MKKIFLFDPTCLSYRVHVYEYLMEEFKKEGYDLKIFYDSDQTTIERKGFEPVNFNFTSFLKLHLKEKPEVSIYFIWLRYKFSLFFLIFCRSFLPVKSIVWSKGINISDIHQPLKNMLYYIRQFAADGLIIYSDFEKQFIKSSLEKVFVANNTINQHRYTVITKKKDLRTKYKIKQEKVVLFVGRIQERKRIDLLIDLFDSEFQDYALVIVGPGLNDGYKEIAKKSDNMYYLGPIYEIGTLSEIYSLSDVFCIPGEIGLGINEAFLFGLPVVTTYIRPTSEMELLLENESNGLIFEKDNLEDLKDKLGTLLTNEKLLAEFSANAKNSFEENAKIEYMRDGFLNAIEYVTKLK